MTLTNKKQWPETIDEAIRILDSVLSDKDKEDIRGAIRNDLGSLYQELGILIRDEFGLLKGNDALITATLEIDAYLATMTIICEYWLHLNKMELRHLH
jgi:hypothetical protein